MTTMTITKALATAKALDAKIERELPRLKFYAQTDGTGNFTKVAGYSNTVEDVTSQITGALQSVTDMISERAKIKAAIVASNAVTEVTIGQKVMTVAAAIEAKRSIGYEKQLLISMTKQKIQMDREHATRLEGFNKKLEDARAAAFGKDKKVSAEDIAMITQPIEVRSTPNVLDPIGLDARIKALQESIEDFELNVDFALSESNAKTTIEV
ncbi:hypothetical protein P13BB106kb_p066 [Pectobacterium phage DU_PP_V]|uniref:Tail fiber protein n=1 Tax=Pectobacterium phage DU_PP_V TaxID=2041492 RepID=A0A2D2W787_9CAUD|nr:tail fiber protein [Pectobacterium phage DU_PP_V]ATS94050.1 hypothetical protein P13BB106kb_p066 [Pectobacterium phage DU_PP_V]